jgi:hypothetical protein
MQIIGAMSVLFGALHRGCIPFRDLSQHRHRPNQPNALLLVLARVVAARSLHDALK